MNLKSQLTELMDNIQVYKIYYYNESMFVRFAVLYIHETNIYNRHLWQSSKLNVENSIHEIENT